MDATAGNRAKAARLGADRATTAPAAIARSAATGTVAATTAADTGTGGIRTGADLPKAGRSGEIGAMTRPGATRAIGPGMIAGPTIGVEATAATADPRTTKIVAGTADPAIAMTDADSMIAADMTTTLVHRHAAAAATADSVVIATGIRGPIPDGAETSVIDRADSAAPTMRHAVAGTTAGTVATTVTAIATTVTAIATTASAVGTTATVAAIRVASVAARTTAAGRASRAIVPVDSGAREMNLAAVGATVAPMTVDSVGVSTRVAGPGSPTVGTARSATTPGARTVAAVASDGVTTIRPDARSHAQRRSIVPALIAHSVDVAGVTTATSLRPSPRVRGGRATAARE
ncbi:hypothetical protein GV794_23405 [Nocardia cyriacigeorgica]|uniref:Uncharacterized protein n=1 Tax=Nocardia cyriacigeorgica TaxID=135487 RepID=A0ABX0CPZ3_9NOCA|nr:hypothetical protein [Nocardia cyriacigeorgica]NEW52373.1 hypothetical protein [Nocardia cyriacigeorgica]NEW58568.1 hypothetical protein [Nocardia cyriacigeorgica]